MSTEVEEDAELRDLVAHTLETNGVLGKLRAQLRASVFLALDEQDPVKHKAPFRNQEFKKFSSSADGQQTLHIVREFLHFFNLEYSLAVFDAETDCSSEPIVRPTLLKQLDLTESTETSQLPVISEVIRQFRNEENDKLHSNSTQSKVADVDSVKPTPVVNSKKTISHDDSTDNDDDDDFFNDSNRSVKDDKKSKDLAESSTPPLNSSIGGLPTLPDKKLLRNEDSDDDNEYEADFQLSNVTPLGQTPRSARSDARTIETEEVSEEIEEEEEDLGDLIRSDASQLTELTTDRTVSPTDVLDKVAKADYLEDVLGSQS